MEQTLAFFLISNYFLSSILMVVSSSSANIERLKDKNVELCILFVAMTLIVS